MKDEGEEEEEGEGAPDPAQVGADTPGNDPRIDRLVTCVTGMIIDGNAGFADEMKLLLIQIIQDPDRPNLIMQFADALASPSAPFANQKTRLLQTFILHIDAEIANQKSRAAKHGEAKNGLWNYVVNITGGLGIAVSVAPIWMTEAGPYAPFVAAGLIAGALYGGVRRRQAFNKEQDAIDLKRGLESLNGALSNRL